MPVTLVFVHYREVRRFKYIEAESKEEGERLFEQFVESEATGDDSAWDEVEDNDPGESELREILGKGCQKSDELFGRVEIREKGSQELGHLSDSGYELRELLGGLPVGCVCRTCGAHVPVDHLRIHVATHNDGAWTFDTDQVWDSFEVLP